MRRIKCNGESSTTIRSRLLAPTKPTASAFYIDTRRVFRRKDRPTVALVIPIRPSTRGPDAVHKRKKA
jgi:hypothetical protein